MKALTRTCFFIKLKKNATDAIEYTGGFISKGANWLQDDRKVQPFNNNHIYKQHKICGRSREDCGSF